MEMWVQKTITHTTQYISWFVTESLVSVFRLQSTLSGLQTKFHHL